MVGGCATAAGLPEGSITTTPLRVVWQNRLAILRASPDRRDGRVAEGARLESVYTGNRIVGSNPTPSARQALRAGGPTR